jgi:hypothetical protein
VQLAAARVDLRRPCAEAQPHVRQRVAREYARAPPARRSTRGRAARRRARREPELDRVAGGLHDLEAIATHGLLDDGRHREWRQPHDAAVACAQAQHVVAPAFDA